MSDQSTYHRTVVQVTILSKGPYQVPDTLSGIEYDIMDGDCVGTVETAAVTELTGQEMADALTAAGSQPEFLGLTDDGQPDELDD